MDAGRVVAMMGLTSWKRTAAGWLAARRKAQARAQAQDQRGNRLEVILARAIEAVPGMTK